MIKSKQIDDLFAGKLGSSDRSFGLVMAAFFGGWCALSSVSADAMLEWKTGLTAIAFLFLAILAPRLLRPLNILWTAFGLLLHVIVGPLVLAILFYLVFTPTGVLMRAFGRDPLQRRIDKEANSYWTAREKENRDANQMRLQF